MNNTIPTKVVRKIISDILIERSNAIMQASDEIAEKSFKETGVCDDYACDVATEACGTRMLADEIEAGAISIEEAITEILTREERQEAKSRCLKYIEEKQKGETER